ncbi:MAG: hypothetical protein ICV83_28195 [Cytophagales bacterium]|nr:hypothetical protein [Cytophagales bacterium]
MDHQYIQLEAGSATRSLVLFQKDNNLDGKDNLGSLPEAPAVYAICGRVNGTPANPRYVGETDDLQRAVRMHFEASEPGQDECFKEFMLSIKTKVLLYEVLPGSTGEERQAKKREWEATYKPVCTKELNEVH